MRCSGPVLLLVLLAVLCCTAGCGRRARLIPDSKMKRIVVEMYLADQWFREHPNQRAAGDTTLVFDPIFRRFGYTFEDYDKSVHYYLDHPDKYNKVLSGASEQLRARGDQLQKELEAWREHERMLDAFRRLYKPQDFSDDSLRWTGRRILWPERTTRDTLVIIH